MLNDDVFQEGLRLAEEQQRQALARQMSPKPVRTKRSGEADPQGPVEERPEEDFGFLDYVSDIGRGLLAGGEGFVKSIGSLVDSIGEAVGFDLVEDDTFWETKIETKTWLGGLTDGVTQFALGFLIPGGIVGRVAKLGALAAKYGKAGLIAQGMIRGAVADFTAFQEHEERLSNFIQQFPDLQNPITEYLAADENDSWVEGRLKNAIEGLGLGAVTDVMVAAVRGFKGMKAAVKSGDQIAYEEAVKQADEAIGKALGDQLDEAGNLKVELNNDDLVQLTVERTGAESSFKLDDAARETIAKQVRSRLASGESLDAAVYNSLKTTVNPSKILGSDDMQGTIYEIYKAIDDKLWTESGGVLSNKVTERLAKELAEKGIENPMPFFKEVEELKVSAEKMPRMLLAMNYYMDTLAEALSKVIKAQDRPGANLDLLTQQEDVLTQRFVQLISGENIVQKSAARTTQIGNVAHRSMGTTAERLYNNLKDVVNGMHGDEARLRVRQVMKASEGDPKVLTKIFHMLDHTTEKGLKRALSIHNEVWINSILSGMRTQATNVLSGMMQSILMPAERIVGGTLSLNKEAIQSGFRLYAGLISEAFDMFNLIGIANRMGDKTTSTGAVWNAFIKERGVLDLAAKATDELGREVVQHAIHSEGRGLLSKAINGLGILVRLPSRLMTTTDEIFKQLNYRAALRDNAMQAGMSKGLKGEKLAEFVAKYMDRGFDREGMATMSSALQYAREITFTQQLRPGTVGRSVQRFVGEHPMARLVVPFVRTPTNIFRRWVQYTPGLNFLQKEYQELFTRGTAAERGAAYGRLAIGSSFYLAATGLVAAGKITGNGPSNPEERKALMATGWRPLSFVVTNDDGTKEYISYKRMDPIAMILGLVADFGEAQARMSDDEADSIGMAMVMSLAKNLTNKTYLTGISEVINAMSQPDRHLKRWAESRIASYVPNFFGQANGDEYFRETRSLLDAARRKIPGLSESLPPTRNFLGEAVPVEQGWLPFSAGTVGARWVSPFGYSKSVSDPVKEEIAKLAHGFAPPSKTMSGVNLQLFKNEKGQDAHDRYQQLIGEVTYGHKTLAQSLERLIKSKSYQRLPEVQDDPDPQNPARVKAIQKELAKYRERARHQLLREYPDLRDAIRQLERARGNRSSSYLIRLSK